MPLTNGCVLWKDRKLSMDHRAPLDIHTFRPSRYPKGVCSAKSRRCVVGGIEICTQNVGIVTHTINATASFSIRSLMFLFGWLSLGLHTLQRSASLQRSDVRLSHVPLSTWISTSQAMWPSYALASPPQWQEILLPMCMRPATLSCRIPTHGSV